MNAKAGWERTVPAFVAGHQDDDGISPLVTLCHYDIPQALVEQGGPNMASLADMPVRLHFIMRSAKLFAFQSTTL